MSSIKPMRKKHLSEFMYDRAEYIIRRRNEKLIIKVRSISKIGSNESKLTQAIWVSIIALTILGISHI